MNKYFLFSGNGRTTGWDGFCGVFKSIDAAKLWLDQNSDYEWAEIVDVDSLTVVWTEFGKD